MKKITFSLLLLAVYSSVAAQHIRLVPFIQNLTEPTAITTDDNNRFFITQRHGTIILASSAGTPLTQPFLDITDRVKSDGQEQGLLGIALSPAYSNNGYFYVHYTGVGDSVHISRFFVDPADSNHALASSEQKILTIYKPYQNHNGGAIHFGPDLKLYIGLGDGGGAGDPGNRAQNKGELLGKILRIDVITGPEPYSIPPDNPFVNDPTARGEIWAWGLRNPWRFSFDKLTGDLWIGDVGQGSMEEIDMQTAATPGGQNYGWRCYEGTLPYNTDGCQPQSSYVQPVYEYPHDATPCWSVTGGYIYRGTAYPPLSGRYFFAEYCKDIIWSIHDSSGTWVPSTEGVYPGNSFSTFGEDKNGELYIAGLSSGTIFKIADSVVGIEAHSSEFIHITPNPFHDKMNVSISNYHGPYDVAITDLSGRKIFSEKYYSDEFSPDLQTIPEGIYLLQIKNRAFSAIKVIVKR